MRARRCAERASGSRLGGMRPFVTATHHATKSTTADSLDTVHGADSRVRRGDPLPTRRSCVPLLEAQCHVSVRYRKKERCTSMDDAPVTMCARSHRR
eukprot:4675001-Prymnesium_polylepis.1